MTLALGPKGLEINWSPLLLADRTRDSPGHHELSARAGLVYCNDNWERHSHFPYLLVRMEEDRWHVYKDAASRITVVRW